MIEICNGFVSHFIFGMCAYKFLQTFFENFKADMNFFVIRNILFENGAFFSLGEFFHEKRVFFE